MSTYFVYTKYIPLFFLLLALSASAQAETQTEMNGRFFIEGDGHIEIVRPKTGKKAAVNYRNSDGSYNRSALDAINRVFALDKKSLGEDISLRTISILDHLQDKFAPNQTLALLSGYRSPEYNLSLRKSGHQSARTSYHLEGMAADVVFPGGNAKKIWEYVRLLDCCGAGYYHGQSVHIDSGRPRFWITETAIPKGDADPQNRNIYLAADKDIYLPGETIRLFFSGVSTYPFGVKRKARLTGGEAGTKKVELEFATPEKQQRQNCLPIADHRQSRHITWRIPEDFRSDGKKTGIKITFCDPVTPLMPKKILSRAFTIAVSKKLF